MVTAQPFKADREWLSQYVSDILLKPEVDYILM